MSLKKHRVDSKISFKIGRFNVSFNQLDKALELTRLALLHYAFSEFANVSLNCWGWSDRGGKLSKFKYFIIIFNK